MESGRSAVALAVAALDRGDRPEEGLLRKALLYPPCPAFLVEQLAGSSWALLSSRLLPLMLTHPACPRTFAWNALSRLSWRDLVVVTSKPRTAPAIRKQAEHKLVERLAKLTLGERTALARIAPRGVIAALLGQSDESLIRALLDNGRFTEGDAVRLLAAATSWQCATAVLRHPRWGVSRAVKRAALRCPHLPLAVSMGLLATLSAAEAEAAARSRDVPEAVRDAARSLFAHRCETGRRAP